MLFLRSLAPNLFHRPREKPGNDAGCTETTEDDAKGNYESSPRLRAVLGQPIGLADSDDKLPSDSTSSRR